MAERQSATTAPERRAPDDGMPLLGVDHVEMYVGNAAQAAYYFQPACGSRRVAYAGLEPGARERVSHVLRHGDVCLVITGALRPEGDVARRVALRGDGARVIALAVPNAERAYRTAVARGARAIEEPHEAADEHGAVRLASIATYGDVIHTVVERGGYARPPPPGLR